MNKKIKVFISLISATVLMFVTALPTFALNVSLHSVALDCYNEYIPSLSSSAISNLKNIVSSSGYDLDSYKWCIFGKVYNNSRIVFDFVSLPSDKTSFDFGSNGWLYSKSTYSFTSPLYCRVFYDISGDTPSFEYLSDLSTTPT